MGLVNMNGRLYDPALARFVSADPFVQNPDDWQSYNRYSYVLNNPFLYTDPSGYFHLGRFLRTVAAIGAAWYLGPGAYSFTGITSGVATGALGNVYASAFAAGFAAGGIQGGTLKSALQGGASALLFVGAGELATNAGFGAQDFGRAVFHGAAGCVNSVMGGGKCGNGFISAAFTEYASSNIGVGKGVAANLAKTAVIGGTASVLSGGKFANGAVTGSFQYLFNAGLQAAVEGQAQVLRRVAGAVSDYVDQMSDVCSGCSRESFSKMTLIASPQTATQAGFDQGVLASYDASSNAATFYQDYFGRNAVTQASAMFHEYLHSLPENQEVVRAGTPEQSRLPHPQRPWEAPVIRLETIFLERHGQEIWRRLK